MNAAPQTAAPGNTLARRLLQLGPLRLALIAAAVVLMLLVPEPGTRAVYHGFAAVTTMVVPALTPIIFMVLLLDALMSAVFMIDQQGFARSRLKLALALDLLLAAGLVAVWYPYFRALAG